MTTIDRVGRAEQLLRSVVDSLDSMICIVGDEGVIVGTNRRWDQLRVAMSWGPERAGVGANFFELLASIPAGGADLAAATAAILADVVAGAPEQLSVRGAFPMGDDGEHVVVRVHPVTGHDVARAVITLIDITAATRTQVELRRITDEAQLLALVAQHTENAVVIADAGGRIEWANAAFCRMSGYRLDELVGRKRQDLTNGYLSSSPAFTRFAAALTAGRAEDVKFLTQTKDGRPYWVHIQLQPIREEGQSLRSVSIERDITTQRAADERLRVAINQTQLLADQLTAEKSLLSDVLGSIPHLVYWKDQRLRYTGLNQAFLALRGLDGNQTVLDRTEAELDVSDALSTALLVIEPEVLATGRPVENQRVLLNPPDRPPCVVTLSVLPQTDEDGGVIGVIGVAADVTHVSALEQQLAQATRLESIGQLAAGIAHEINTPVQYVSDNTRFLEESFGSVLTALRAVDELAVGDDPLAVRLRTVVDGLDLDFLSGEIPGALTQSLEGLDRVAQIVRAMKDFSHPGQGRVAADLNRAVESTAQVSRNEWRYVATMELDLDPEVGMVRCHEGELKQVLLNIVVNAAHALAGDPHPGRSGQALGSIAIRTQRIGDAVRIVITDDGPGMDDAIQAKIFDPFFTTKPVGKGTGQGLSMAYSVIQKHGGKLTVTSAVGVGSTFTIELPDDPVA